MLKVLIVDDEPRIRRIISDFLKKDNYEIDEAENGEIALQKFKKNIYTFS